MPEGDTVVRAARRLNDALAGRRLTRAELRVPRHATARLAGRAVEETVPRGKHLLTRIEGDLTLHTHLRMDGTWRTYRAQQRWRGGPAHQARVLLENDEWRAVGFRLPVVDLLPRAREHAVVGHLGPDLLAPDFDEDESVRRLAAQPDLSIGVALLDQRLVAGIGNVYRMELCFLSGLSPWTPVGDSDVRSVLRLARRMMLANVERPRRTTTSGPWAPPGASRGGPYWVAERGGRPCRRCGTLLRSADQGSAGRERVTHWCPSCQPAPSAGQGAAEDLPGQG